MRRYLIIIMSALILCSCANIGDNKSSSDISQSSSLTSSSQSESIEPEEPELKAESLEELIDMVKAEHPDVSSLYERENDYIVGDNFGTFVKSYPKIEVLEYIRGTNLTDSGITYTEAFERAKEIDKRLSAYLSNGGKINTNGFRIPDNITARDDKRDRDLNIFYRSVGALNIDDKPFYRVEVYIDTEEYFTDVYYVSADKNHNIVYLVELANGAPILVHDSNEKLTEIE